MKIIPIFAGNLWSVQYDDEEFDEFTRLFDSWQNIEYLFDFVDEHKELLDVPFWEDYDSAKIIGLAYHEAQVWMSYFKSLHENCINGKKPDFEDEFHIISDRSCEMEMIKSKAYGKEQNRNTHSVLRLYAIKVENNAYVITGGAIKLTRTMNECPYLCKELYKLDLVRSWLSAQGIIEKQDLNSFENE